MFLAILATLLAFASMVALASRAPKAGRPFTQVGLGSSLMATLLIVGDYFIQLTVIQPSVLAHEADGISLLTQYKPHGVFIALEELGYLLLSLSLAFMIPALSRATASSGRFAGCSPAVL